MKYVALNTSIVVVAGALNPGILHPSFLSAQGIVPKDWELLEPPICLPPVSTVKYHNNVAIVMELNKLTIRDDSPKEDKSPLTDIAVNLVVALYQLAQTDFKAVGINTGGYIECADPEAWMVGHFLKKGAGNDGSLKPKAVGLKYVYGVEGGDLHFNCDPGEVTTQTVKGARCILVNANYHTGISSKQTAFADAQAAIMRYGARLDHFVELVDLVFGNKQVP